MSRSKPQGNWLRGLGMLATEFSTDVVAAPERFVLWVEATGESHMRNRLRSNDCHDFRARMRSVDLMDVQVAVLAYPHLEIARTTKLIRQSDPEVYQINYFLGGQGNLTLDRRDVRLGTGDLVVMDSSRPFRGDVHADPGRWSHLTVQLPRKLLPLPEKTVQGLLAVPISGRSGMGGVFARWLTDLTAHADEFTPADIPAFTQVTVDLLTSLLGRCLGADDAMGPQLDRRTLQVRICDYIHQNLGESALSVGAIAAAHRISVRRLYQLFAEEDTTPAAWIRERRLECCRRDLADLHLRSRPIHAIAARWGFPDPAHFSRIFRSAYGISPRDYRHHALHGQPRAETDK
ncbi:helix-turn-helix domain-containing protein [Streptomyces sp. NPDC087218]|uniref:AraC-like ligand-binding domain-containing protein n=1 Tax=Streptomyces sp. NPDC087218 TaxID=3365769 RepID=UPI00382910E3